MNSLCKFSIPYVPIDDYNCQTTCCNFVGKNGKDLFSHYRRIHISDSSFSSGCLFSKVCTAKFKSFSGLRKHMYEFHRTFFTSDEPSADESSSSRIGNVNSTSVDDTVTQQCELEHHGMPDDVCFESLSNSSSK
jgi:hypothetical protein